jgi:hypothetical protein
VDPNTVAVPEPTAESVATNTVPTVAPSGAPILCQFVVPTEVILYLVPVSITADGTVTSKSEDVPKHSLSQPIKLVEVLEIEHLMKISLVINTRCPNCFWVDNCIR